MDKYRPCPSIFAMFTSDSQHPPRSRHAVYLGDVAVLTSFCAPTCILKDELSVLAKTIMNSLDTTYFKRMHLLFSDYSSF